MLLEREYLIGLILNQTVAAKAPMPEISAGHSHPYSSIAQPVERDTVNVEVFGSNPNRGAIYIHHD